MDKGGGGGCMSAWMAFLTLFPFPPPTCFDDYTAGKETCITLEK